MSEPIGQDNIRERLTAFADGELDAAQILAVLDYLVDHPGALEMMRTQQRLRLAAERAFKASPTSVPEDLRRRIEAMTPDLPAAAAAPDPRAGRRRRWWMTPALAATLLVGGLLVGRFAFPPAAVPPGTETADAVPATVVAHAARAHVDCSRFAGAAHTAGFPKELAGLAALLRSDLKTPGADNPDLSSIGFRFVGAGPCAAPLTDTAHLLYRSTAPGEPRMLSVFVQQYKGQFALAQGKVYDVAGPRSPFSVYAWRTGQVVYFLIADDQATVTKARATLTAAVGL